MIKNIIVLSVTCLILFSCNNIDKKNFEVIEGIELGTNFKKYQEQLDSIGIQTKSFYTKSVFLDLNEVEYNEIKGDISEIFNLSDFKNRQTNHYAILYPTTLAGTDNVTGINVIIGHTSNSIYLGKTGYVDLTKRYGKNLFNQNISKDLLDQIKVMLTSKYGEPSLDAFESIDNSFFVLQGYQIKEFIGEEKRKGKLTRWETEYLEIELFEGLASIDAVYSKNVYNITTPLIGEPTALVIDFDKGERPCVTYVYIKYSLKQETINKLKLDEKKI